MSLNHFTSQQLQGGPKYSQKSCMGNWYEDRVNDVDKFKNYINSKEQSNLLVSKNVGKFDGQLSKISTKHFESNVLTTGIYFSLKNLYTNGNVVINIEDRNFNHKAAFGVSNNPYINFPCPKNLFKMEKYNEKKQIYLKHQEFEPQPINYGDKIILVSHPTIYENPLYLYSCLASTVSYSKKSRLQEILMNEEQSYYNCWTIEYPASEDRYCMEGKPVNIKEPFILKHCATGSLLGCDKEQMVSDAGCEFEMCCNNYITSNKYQQIEAEKDGRFKVDTKTRDESMQNLWLIVEE